MFYSKKHHQLSYFISVLKFEKGFEFINKIRFLKFEGDWDKQQTKAFVHRQSLTKYWNIVTAPA